MSEAPPDGKPRWPPTIDPGVWQKALEETRRKEREAAARFPDGKPFPIPDRDEDP